MNLVEHHLKNTSAWKYEPNGDTFVIGSRPCHIFRDYLGVLHGVIGFQNHDLGGPNYSGYFLYDLTERKFRHRDHKNIPDLPEKYSHYDQWLGIVGSEEGDLIPAYSRYSFSADLKYFSMKDMKDELTRLVPLCEKAIIEERARRLAHGR